MTPRPQTNLWWRTLQARPMRPATMVVCRLIHDWLCRYMDRRHPSRWSDTIMDLWLPYAGLWAYRKET